MIEAKSHLDHRSLVYEGFIMWLEEHIFPGGRKSYSQIVKIAYLANLFSQSEHMIWLFLPARGASHILLVVISSLRILLLISVDKSAKNGRNLKSCYNSFSGQL